MPAVADVERHGDLELALRERGLYVTAPRLAVAAAVSAHPHATTDEIIAAVDKAVGSVSRQAVYDLSLIHI